MVGTHLALAECLDLWLHKKSVKCLFKKSPLEFITHYSLAICIIHVYVVNFNQYNDIKCNLLDFDESNFLEVISKSGFYII